MSKILTKMLLVLALAPVMMLAGTYNLVGHVTYPNGDSMPGVTITMTGPGPTQTDITNDGGTFQLHGVNGEYTFTPSRNGCRSFTPPQITKLIDSNFSHLDFVADCDPDRIVLISPPNGAIDVSTTPTLSWRAPGATEFQLRFGIAPTPPDLTALNALSYTFTDALASGTTYYWQVLASNASGHWSSSTIWSFKTIVGAIPPGLRFIPLPACRIADTRAGSGRTGEYGEPAFTAGETRAFHVSASTNCAVPASAKAYSLNVTVVPPPVATGYMTIWPTPAPAADQTPPATSTINFNNGRVIADAVIVGAGDQGAINVFSAAATDFIIDINGYFDNQAGTGAFWFYPATPCRVSDTRNDQMPAGYGTPVMAANETRRHMLAGMCSLPLGAAYSLNVTALPDPALNFLDYLSIWAADQPTQPVVSTLNSYDGDIVANAAIVPASSTTTTVDTVAITPGMVSTFVPQTANVILDTNGYFGPEDATGLSFYPVLPCRAVDTRNISAPSLLGKGSGRSFALAGTCGVSPTAKAIVVNATVEPLTTFLDYLTLYPTGATTMPVVSTLNSYRGKIVANMAVVPLGTGALTAYVTDNADLMLDVLGYFE